MRSSKLARRLVAAGNALVAAGEDGQWWTRGHRSGSAGLMGARRGALICSFPQAAHRSTRGPRAQRNSESGDTLIEVLLALVVLGLASIALIIAFQTSISKRSSDHQESCDQMTHGACDGLPGDHLGDPERPIAVYCGLYERRPTNCDDELSRLQRSPRASPCHRLIRMSMSVSDARSSAPARIRSGGGTARRLGPPVKTTSPN